ncbi:uncharacterized protein F5Z01DRAFT_678620 [Emericellopsis atlantica]|uniref:Uncharacterized protein n=1 Tax=Emericellopsis atlantica TaxID=2614577 RepID=A0A9P7ZCW9_9HYPO|nr:uncharacterized protein F5Z01DRAFT_678620 [Emericellopsis atlantica]KAG9249502.1 hypothetical protein F5Z01DRAFT_678620 [Emericellopsis atlantica]
MPTKVRVDLDGSGQIATCFFKAFGPGITGGPVNRERNAYKGIYTSGLGEDVHVGGLVGIAHEHQSDSTVGLLLRYIDHRGTLYDVVDDNPGPDLRKKWAAQIEKAVADSQKDNAWLTDFEGGYTHGWVDPDKAETVEGDLQGLQRIMRFIFEGPQADQ